MQCSQSTGWSSGSPSNFMPITGTGSPHRGQGWTEMDAKRPMLFDEQEVGDGEQADYDEDRADALDLFRR